MFRYKNLFFFYYLTSWDIQPKLFFSNKVSKWVTFEAGESINKDNLRVAVPPPTLLTPPFHLAGGGRAYTKTKRKIEELYMFLPSLTV